MTADSRMNVLGLVTAIFRHPILFFSTAALILTAVVVALLSIPERYSAESKFITDVAEVPIAIPTGVGGALGLGSVVEVGRSGETPQFFAELVRSRDLLRSVALARYELPGGSGSEHLSGTLVELYRAEYGISPPALGEVVDILEEQVYAAANPKTGLVMLRTTTPSPSLAIQMNRQILRVLNDFNVQRRQREAVRERELIETQLRAAADELARREGEFRHFLESNRRYEESPRLQLVAAELERSIALQQQVYVSLATALDQAKIEAVRNTAVITVIDGPEASVERVSTGRFKLLLLGGALALMFAAGAVILAERLRPPSPEHIPAK